MPKESSLVIRKLDPRVKAQLKKRAAANGRSMEAEARILVAEGLKERGELSIGDAFYQAFGPENGIEDLIGLIRYQSTADAAAPRWWVEWHEDEAPETEAPSKAVRPRKRR